MTMKRDVTVPLSITVGSAATFVGHAVMHYWVYGNDSSGYFAFRFFAPSATVILLVLIPAGIVLTVRLARHRGTALFRRRAAYGWFFSTLVILGPLALLAFSGIDSYGYWRLIFFVGLPISLLVACVAGFAAMLILMRTLRRRLTEAE